MKCVDKASDSVRRELPGHDSVEPPTLEESSELQRYLDIAGVIFVLINAAGNITLINKKGGEVLGYRESEILGKNWFDIAVPKRLRDGARRNYQKVLAGNWQSATPFEAPLLTGGGQERPVAWNLALLTDETGRISGTLSSGEDMTRLRQAEQKCRLVSLLSELDPAPAACFDKQAKVLLANTAAREMLAMEPVPGASILSLLPGIRQSELAACVSSGRRGTRTVQIGGRMFHFVFRGVPELGVGHIHGTDITELQQIKEKMMEYGELNRLKSNLLSTATHELKTPLATIKGYTTMLLDYGARLGHEEERECLDSINKAADRLGDFVGNILKNSRLESGLLRLEKTPVAICDLVLEIVDEGRVRFPGHRLVIKLPDRLPRVKIDASRIREVLDNLIDNAAKYSEAGTEITVKVGLAGSEVVIGVADQGTGIPAAELEKVFDRMYRIERRLALRESGIGLGLAICKWYVEAHGGRIWMESEPGKGATCWFTLPL